MSDLRQEFLSTNGPGSLGPQEVASPSVPHTPLLLKGLVERFRVCWEVRPEYVEGGSEKRQIGFALELSGTHEGGMEDPSPSCQPCQQIFAALQVIAGDILPRERRPSTYEIEPSDLDIHYVRSHAHENGLGVTLTIRILHRDGSERPVDVCQVRCLTEMKERLEELGACERAWTSQKKSCPSATPTNETEAL